MKTKLIGLLFVCVFVLLASSACSSQDEPAKQLTAKDLAYTVWYRDHYSVRKSYSNSGYYLNLSFTKIITFTDESGFIEATAPSVDPSEALISSGSSWEGRYRIVKDLYFENGIPYRITNYTGDRFEAIPTDDFSEENAQKSGFGYTRKYVFRRVKL